jgi:hypothetical protein
MDNFFRKFSILEKTLLVLYSILILGLFVYSFTQIDLSLTFSRIEMLRNIVGIFQHIGYFERPLSTYIYISIVILLFVFYILFLRLAARKKISKPFIWSTILVSAVLLVFSYNAFSYDMFNYIFDAKIITHYHQNPYEHKALDYQGDPMLSFMRWTHRVYPYGPVWLGITIPLSFAGFNIFLITFFIFKLLLAASYLGCTYFIGKVFQKIAPQKEIFGLVFFALNPLVIIESLVSGHIDSVMMFFSAWAIYTMVQKKYIISYITLLLSIGIKFVTAFLLPVFLFLHFYQKKNKHVPWDFVFGLGTILLTIGVMIESHQSTFQPWYILAVLPIAVFVAHRYIVLIPSVIISIAALFNYVPFLFTGNWDKPIPQILSDLNITSYCISFFVIALYFGYQQIQFAKHVKKHQKSK